ncbi:MAG: TPM domain-containing protein [Nitrospiraceae bacterium]|nr:TPM domain-containing protein [Nitrospiraceae bacterium]
MTSIFKKLLAAAALVIVVLVSSSPASTPQPPATPRDYVVDLAGVIPEEVQTRLNAYLKELEQKTTAQVLVLTVQSLDGQSIEEFSFKTKEAWKLGQKGKDNGVLIVVAVKDRKYRIEIGYGLESVLPDSLVGSIGREYLVPYFRKGDYGAGIYAATLAVANTIASDQGVQITGMPGMTAQPRTVSDGKPLGAFQTIMVVAFIVIALILCITHPRQCFFLLLVSQMGGGRGGWSGGDGGFGGGGSFGGGGGGSGGGGGASGGW